jgi:hypothetical protein
MLGGSSVIPQRGKTEGISHRADRECCGVDPFFAFFFSQWVLVRSVQWLGAVGDV